MNKGGNPNGGFTWLSQMTAGFTIIETLIVLAVTSALLVSAFAVINGRQNKTEFMTAINDTAQQMQQIINETASGYFPNNNSFTCVKSGSGPSISPGGGIGQGTNTDCIFLGKVVQFGLGASPEQYAVHSIAGLRSATDIVTAKPVDVYNNNVTDILVTQNLENGLTVDHMTYDALGGGSGIDTAGAAILAGDSTGSFATANASGLNSGSQQFSLYAVKPTKVNAGGDTISTMAAKINSNSPNTFQHASRVQICLSSGTTNQSGLITIGDSASGSQLTVDLAIRSNLTCT